MKNKIPQRKVSCYGSFRPTEEVFQAWQVIKEIALSLKATVILFQCPASFTPTFEHQRNMKHFFQRVQRHHFLFAWEPRGPSWTEPIVRSLCEQLGLIHCVDPILQEPVTSGRYYLRLHGGKGYTHRYSRKELLHIRERFKRVRGQGCLLFNNVSMWDDAAHFQELLSV